jgi:hypothetical protein
VNPGGGFTGAVNLTCSVTGASPSDVDLPSCSFGPAQVTVTVANQAVTSTLKVTTTSASTGFLHRPRSPFWFGTGGSALALAVLLGLPGLGRKRRAFVSFFALLCVLCWTSGCGGGGAGNSGGSGGGSGGGGGGGNSGTTPDTYTVTFNAADAATGKVTAQDYFKFTVN